MFRKFLLPAPALEVSPQTGTFYMICFPRAPLPDGGSPFGDSAGPAAAIALPANMSHSKKASW